MLIRNESNTNPEGMVEDFNARLFAKGGTYSPVLIVILGLLIMFLNVLAIIALYRSVRMEAKIRQLSMNLAASDILVGFNLVTYIALYIKNAVSYPIICQGVIQLPRIAYFVGTFITTSFAVDRCLCLYKWQNYNRRISKRMVTVFCVSVWTVSTVLTVISYWNTNVTCRSQEEIDISREEGVLAILVLMAVSFLLIFMCYFAVFLNIIKHLNNIRNMGISKREYCYTMFRSTFILTTIVLAFLVCYGPIFSFKYSLYFYPESDWNTREMRLFAQFIHISNSVINPFIYTWRFAHCQLEMKLLCTFNQHKKEALIEQKKLLCAPFLQRNVKVQSNTAVAPH